MKKQATLQIVVAALLAIVSSSAAFAQEAWSFILPEQRCLEVRDPSQLCKAEIPNVPKPPTVADPQFDIQPNYLTLSDTLNISLSNLEVVRVLGGVSATSSGNTVYDVAIRNTTIDQQRAVFDPNFRANNGWNRSENPGGVPNPVDPTQTIITGGRTDNYAFDLGLSKRTVTGGVIDFGVNSNDNRFRPGTFPLNPQIRSSTDLSFTQPLLQGGGVAVNQIPIVLARIDTERSYFQYKNSIQRHVQSVIAGYWALVFARTDLWARQQQVDQLEFAYRRAEDQFEVGISNIGEVSQTRVAYENFRANLLASEANVLQREAALRNVMGLPPYEPTRLTPVSPLIDEQLDVDWDGVLTLAETQRPDIIELKLILEADQQRLLLSRNQAQPRLDGVALYRWNGLEGEMPNGLQTSSQAGQFADWNLGVNFSVPLGLRRDRALLRQQELVIQRDQANLEQGLFQALHNLALNVRNLAQFYQQYERFQAVRAAARINLDAQLAAYSVGNVQFIVALQAIVDWGNAVSSEAQSLVQYNTELANLEFETGTILETHGIAFFEERYGSLGPLGRLGEEKCYPLATPPTPNVGRYGSSGEPSEEFFDLRDPLEEGQNLRRELRDAVPDAEADAGAEEVSPSDDDSAGKLSAPVRAARALRNLFR